MAEKRKFATEAEVLDLLSKTKAVFQQYLNDVHNQVSNPQTGELWFKRSGVYGLFDLTAERRRRQLMQFLTKINDKFDINERMEMSDGVRTEVCYSESGVKKLHRLLVTHTIEGSKTETWKSEYRQEERKKARFERRRTQHVSTRIRRRV